MLVWAWLLAIGIGIVRWKARGDPLPLSVWVAFATAAFFSSVAEEWIVGVIPAAALVPAVMTFCSAAAMRRLVVASTLLVAGLLLSVFVVLGIACRPADILSIRRSSDGMRLSVGEGTPDSWIVCDTATMGGAAYGRALTMSKPELQRASVPVSC